VDIMEKGQSLTVSGYAQRRMLSRGLNDSHIWYCMFYHKKEYRVGKDMVWDCMLPDHRNIKVRVEYGSSNPIVVKDVFTYQ